MANHYYVNDECSRAVRISIVDRDECGLLDYETNDGLKYNEIEAEIITEEPKERESVDNEENTWEVESNDIYIGRVFANEDEAYDTYNSYALA